SLVTARPQASGSAATPLQNARLELGPAPQSCRTLRGGRCRMSRRRLAGWFVDVVLREEVAPRRHRLASRCKRVLSPIGSGTPCRVRHGDGNERTGSAARWEEDLADLRGGNVL